MVFVRFIAGILLGSTLILGIGKVLPTQVDLSDWGAGVYPRTYLLPLIILFVLSYFGGWISGKVVPEYGRLGGMVTGLTCAFFIAGYGFTSNLFSPLFHHPAYPPFSDHALLALAIMLAGCHLGGARGESCRVNDNPSCGFSPDNQSAKI